MTRLLALVLVATSVATSGLALADDISADPNDAGKVTAIHKGVSEIDLGGIFVLNYDKAGDTSNTRFATLASVGYQYFVNTNLSVGGNALVNYDRQSSAVSGTAFGGSLFGTLHVRLGFGAFFRPTLALGALVGSQQVDTGLGGLVVKSSTTAFLTRIAIPFAYFAGRRVVIQAGPEFDISLSNVKRAGGGYSQSYTSVTGGFSVGAGYTF
ncbi:MAG: hypothetical protein NT062_34800 [Proteobacteria bacterium]|nr:hypothetical protein [Pseudomonadota bacterium]